MLVAAFLTSVFVALLWRACLPLRFAVALLMMLVLIRYSSGRRGGFL